MASRLFRSHGIEATGVAQIMSAAGLTHSGFYRHFASEDELIAEAVASSLEKYALVSEQAADEGAEAALDYTFKYLSTSHRDDVEQSCPFAAAASELARTGDGTRRVASQAFKRVLEGLAGFMLSLHREERRAQAICALTYMIGALTMARIVDDRALSDRILEEMRARLIRAIRVTS